MGEKIVYILGAGFSCEGKIPLQTHILKRINDYDIDILEGDRHDVFVRISDELLPAKKKLDDFLDNVFEANKTPSLEDVFTLLDQTISKRAFCHGYSWKDLDGIRDAINRLILIIFHDSLERLKSTGDNFYNALTTYFLEQRVKAGVDSDPFSIVSMNWDSLLEDSLYWGIGQVKGYGKIDVDFGCYTNILDDASPHTPSTLQQAKGIYNIRILKLHGSTNWMICPNCGKLYTGLGSEIDVWSLYVLNRTCKHCSRLDSIKKQGRAPNLVPFFITPTFVKELDDTHVQTIWHNAYSEIAEASKIVFIGYSLPEADYHLRTLIRRAIQPDIPIDVVLYKNDRPPRDVEGHMKRFYPKTQYNDFFQSHPVKFYFKGVKSYFSDEMNKASIRTRFKRIRKYIK